jgi:putative aldouronate transport system permease protein
MINEVIWSKAKKIIQTILYMPHFLSWVIVSGIWMTILGGAGLINENLINLGIISSPIGFMNEGNLFIPVLLFTDAWKEIGWSAIIYLAAITGIDYQLYEAIKIDGGTKWQEIKYITIPGITNTIVMMFILRIASVMDAGFDQIFNMYSPYVYDVADVISTYTYRLGIGAMEYSQATTIGLFNSIIGFTLVLTANHLARKYTSRGIW